jgi:hypothetical protein
MSSFENHCIYPKKRLLVVKRLVENIGNDGEAGKMHQWCILSDSPNSYAVKAPLACFTHFVLVIINGCRLRGSTK